MAVWGPAFMMLAVGRLTAVTFLLTGPKSTQMPVAEASVNGNLIEAPGFVASVLGTEASRGFFGVLDEGGTRSRLAGVYRAWGGEDVSHVMDLTEAYVRKRCLGR